MGGGALNAAGYVGGKVGISEEKQLKACKAADMALEPALILDNPLVGLAIPLEYKIPAFLIMKGARALQFAT